MQNVQFSYIMHLDVKESNCVSDAYLHLIYMKHCRMQHGRHEHEWMHRVAVA